MSAQDNTNEANATEVALRDLLDIEVLWVGGGDVIQFGG